MKPHHLFAGLAAAATFFCGVVSAPAGTDSLTAQIERQSKISFQGVLDNTGPEGSKAPEVPAGVIIASPSKQDPDCKYF